MSERDLIERLRQELGGIETPMMNGDNLALTLCSHFDNPDQPTDDEHGWSEDALRGQDEVLDAVHAHYAATITRLSEALAEAEKKGAEDWQPIETAPRDGTEVILYFPTYATEKVGVYRWRDVTGPEWEGIDGWSWDAKLGEVEDVTTHWRPLPAQPRDLSQGGQHG